MTLIVEAMSPAEGIGIIRCGQSLRFVRPPYTLAGSHVLAEDSLQDAILKHGFSSSDKQFQTWEEVIAFLNEAAAAFRRALGKEIPEEIPGQDIIDIAPPEVLNAFLDRIEKDLIPQRLFDHAEGLLLALLKSKAWTRQPEIVNRAAELLQRNGESRKKAAEGLSELVSRDIRFQGLENKPGELERSNKMGEQIRERGSIFALAS